MEISHIPVTMATLYEDISKCLLSLKINVDTNLFSGNLGMLIRYPLY